jgi:hypothetical protein
MKPLKHEVLRTRETAESHSLWLSKTRV